MRIANTSHRILKDRHSTGYAGFGYGGEHLWSVFLVDRFDPQRYLVRADTFLEALEVADECLRDTVDPNHLTDDERADFDQLSAGNSDLFTVSPSGRVVWGDADIRVIQVR